MSPARIASIASAAPKLVKMQEVADFFADDPACDDIAKIIKGSAIETKGLSVNPLVEDPREWTAAQRMRRGLAEAEVLGETAIRSALGNAGIGAGEIGMLATVTSSTFSVPGLAVLADRTGMNSSTERLNLGPMGCHGGLSALATVHNWVEARQMPAVVTSVDVISTQLAPPPYDKGKAVSIALFGDAAAALVVTPAGAVTSVPVTRGPVTRGIDFVDHRTKTLPDYVNEVSGHIEEHGLEIKTSRAIPALAASAAVRQPVDDLLSQHGLCRADIRWWAIHPGGRKIVEGMADALNLPDTPITVALEVMGDYGNVAGATVLMVMERLNQVTPLESGEYGMAVALGPGATIWAVLLRGA